MQSAGSAKDFTPGITNTSAQSVTSSTVDVAITKQRKYDMVLTGEQIRSLENGGNYQDWARQFMENGMRVLRNEAETDCVAAIKAGATRAVGTSGTNPFASNADLIADARKVLVDNGGRMTDAHMIIGTSASNALQKLGIYAKANEAGSDAERRSGGFGMQYGFNLAESYAIGTHTKGSGASYQLNGALAVGDTTVTVDTGSGTILAGDVVTISNHQYVVATALTGGAFTINAPGIREVVADNTAITVTNNYTGNLFLNVTRWLVLCAHL